MLLYCYNKKSSRGPSLVNYFNKTPDGVVIGDFCSIVSSSIIRGNNGSALY